MESPETKRPFKKKNKQVKIMSLVERWLGPFSGLAKPFGIRKGLVKAWASQKGTLPNDVFCWIPFQARTILIGDAHHGT